jgi:hypothetical protein
MGTGSRTAEQRVCLPVSFFVQGKEEINLNVMNF